MRSFRVSDKITTRTSNSFNQYLNDINKIKMFTAQEEAECSLRAEKGDKKAIDELVQRNLRFVVSVAKQYETATIGLEDLVNEGNIGLILAAQQYKVSTGFKFITYAVFWIRKMIYEYLSKYCRVVRLPSNKVNGLSKLTQYISTLEQKYGRNVDIIEVIEEYGSKFSSEEISDLELISLVRFESFDTPIGGSDDNTNTLYDLVTNESSNPTDMLISNSDMRKRVNNVLDILKPRDKQIMVDLFGLDGFSPMTLGEVSNRVGLTTEMVRQIKKKSLEKLKTVNI